MTIEPNQIESPSSPYIPSQASPRVQRSEILIERQWGCTAEDLLPQQYYIPDVTVSNLTKRVLADLAENHSVEEVRKALIDILEARLSIGRLDFAGAVLTAQMKLEKASRNSESRVDGDDEMPLATKRKRGVTGGKSATTTPRRTPRKRQRLQSEPETPGTQTNSAPKKKRKKTLPGWKGWAPLDNEGNVVELVPSSPEESGVTTGQGELSMDHTPNTASNGKSHNHTQSVSRPSVEDHPDETDSQATQYVEEDRIHEEEMVDGTIDHASTPDPLHHQLPPTPLAILESTKTTRHKTPVTPNGASASSSIDSNISMTGESLRSGRRSQETVVSSIQPSPTLDKDPFIPSSANSLKVSYLIWPQTNDQSPQTPTQGAPHFRPVAPMVPQAFSSPDNQDTAISSEEYAAQQLLDLSYGSPQSRSPRNGGTPAKPPSTPVQATQGPQVAETATKSSSSGQTNKSTPSTSATKQKVAQCQVQSTTGAQPAEGDDQTPSLEDLLKNMQASLIEPLQHMSIRVDSHNEVLQTRLKSLEAANQELKSTSVNFQIQIVKMSKLRKEYQQAIMEYRKHKKITETCREAIVANDGTAGYQNIINELRENLVRRSKGLPALKQQCEDNFAGLVKSVVSLDEASKRQALVLGQLEEIQEKGKGMEEEWRRMEELGGLLYSVRQDPKTMTRFLEFVERKA